MLRYFFRHSKKLLVVATVTSILVGLSSVGLLTLVNQAIARDGKPGALAAMFFGLCLVFLVAKVCSEISLLHLTQSMIFRLRVTLSRKLLATPQKKLQALGKHRLLAIFTKDIDTFIGISHLLPMTIANCVVIVASFAYMAWLSWQLFVIFMLMLGVGIGGYLLAERVPLQKLARVREQIDTLYQHFRSLVEGSKELQLNAQRGSMYVERVIAPSALDFKRHFVSGMTGYVWVVNAGGIVFYLAIGVLLFVVPSWWRQPAEVVTALIMVVLYLISPINSLMTAIPVLRQAAIALGKIEQLNLALADVEPACPGPDPFFSGGPLHLEFQGVCHRFPGLSDDRPFVLGPLNFSIRQGEILFVVGGNGSGKTTLALLLLGLYEPEKGVILFNGLCVTDANREHYRQHFSAVFADFHVFEHLLAIEQPGSAARAMHYVNRLNMGHKVKVIDGKFSTVDLSSGQRKRLALVASYLEDREIYLFDEWAADQDPDFKKVFYTELLPELKACGKTVIVISHDDGYFACADRIIKLEHGALGMPVEQEARDPQEELQHMPV